MSVAQSSLRNQFLIAMPHLKDPNFHESIVYICDHGEQGAMGIVINRPMELSLSEVVEQLDLDASHLTTAVYSGGPVQMERGFVLHEPFGEWQSSVSVAQNICLTTSRDILRAMAAHQGPPFNLVALGYSGWGAGQLEQEISDNYWLTCPANEQIIFHTPNSDKLHATMGVIGVDYSRLSSQSGHA